MSFRFWKYYTLVVVTIVAIALGIEGILSSTEADSDTLWVPLRDITCLLVDTGPCGHNGHVPLRAIAAADLQLSDARRRALAEGQALAWRQDSGRIAYVFQDRRAQLFLLGPFDDPDADRPNDLLLFLFFFGSIALLLLVLMMPAFRDLARLHSGIARMAKDNSAFPIKLAQNSVVAPIASALNRSITQVRQLLDVQTETTNFIAHDIRTPISRMRFTLALLEDGPEDLKQQLRADLNELEGIVTRYLDFAKQDALNPVLQLAPLHLDQLLAPLVTRHAQVHPELDIRLEAADALLGHADAFSLSRAVDNVLGNATRYARSRIVVRADIRHGICRITVDDDGPGVPFHAQRDLLKPFARADRGQGEREKGFGLGLHIVVRTCLLHGGHVRILSAPALGGARIALSWPNRP